MSCHTGKIPYDTRREARVAMKSINRIKGEDKLKTIYECEVCTKFHLTSMDKETSEKKGRTIDHSSAELKNLRKQVRKSMLK